MECLHYLCVCVLRLRKISDSNINNNKNNENSAFNDTKQKQQLNNQSNTHTQRAMNKNLLLNLENPAIKKKFKNRIVQEYDEVKVNVSASQHSQIECVYFLKNQRKKKPKKKTDQVTEPKKNDLFESRRMCGQRAQAEPKSLCLSLYTKQSVKLLSFRKRKV